MKRLLINLLTVIVIMVVIEVISRIVLSKVYNRDFDSSLIVDNKYGGSPGLKPNAHGVVWGKAFNTDEYGGRKNQGAGNRYKTLYIGDSVTEGVGVDDSSTFVSIAAQGAASRVLNMSLIGYSAADYVNVLSHFASDSTIGEVKIFYCLNDVYGSAKTKDLPVMAKQNIIGTLNGFFQQHYATYKLLKLWVYKDSKSYYKYDRQFYKNGNPRFNEAMACLKTCDSLCRSQSVPLSVYVLPYRSQIHGRINNSYEPQQMVLNYCTANSITCYDVTPALALNNKPEKLYLFADEIHFSMAGHKAVADFISKPK